MIFSQHFRAINVICSWKAFPRTETKKYQNQICLERVQYSYLSLLYELPLSFYFKSIPYKPGVNIYAWQCDQNLPDRYKRPCLHGSLDAVWDRFLWCPLTRQCIQLPVWSAPAEQRVKLFQNKIRFPTYTLKLTMPPP